MLMAGLFVFKPKTPKPGFWPITLAFRCTSSWWSLVLARLSFSKRQRGSEAQKASTLFSDYSLFRFR